MLLWLVFSVLTAGVVAMLLRSARQAATDADGSAEADIAVYADQLAQIEDDAAKGLLSAAEAQSARAEVARRLIARAPAAGRNGNPAASPSGAWGTFTNGFPFVVAVTVPLSALVLYVALGSPGLPGNPHAMRSVVQEGQTEIEKMIATVEARLALAPEDGNGWDVIGPVYLKLERYSQAAKAFANANRILGETPKRLAGFAQSEILANNGMVTPNARTASQRLLALEPARIDARLWLTLAKEQEGDLEGALADYAGILKEPGVNDMMRTAIEQRMAIVTAKSKGEPPPVLAAPAQGDAGARAPADPDQQAMIEAMVARLADRLASSGGSAADWSQLLRSYMVLGRQSDAAKALADARTAMKDDAASLQQINDAALLLGVEGTSGTVPGPGSDAKPAADGGTRPGDKGP